MQLTYVVVLLSGAFSASALPRKLEVRQIDPDTTVSNGRANADFACSQASKIVTTQVAEIAKLKAEGVSVPPYLAGYFSAIDSGRQEIGCPGTSSLDSQSTVTTKDPCDVVNDQHERMMALVTKFQEEDIAVAPYIAGFLAATLDGNQGLGCPPFSGPATEAALSSPSNSMSSSTDSSASS